MKGIRLIMGKRGNPKISVLIPIYNCEAVLDYCIESVCKQTIDKDIIEVILVDDASTDNSLEKCNEYANNYNYIKVVSMSENRGQSHARNKALSIATGEYVFFADSDDWLGPDCLRKLLEYAEDNNADMVIGRVIEVNRAKKRGRVKWCRETIREFCNEDFENNGVFYTTMGPWGRLVKRDLLTDYNIVFPMDVYMFEDVYWNIQILHYASKVCIINDYDYYFLRRDGGLPSLTTIGKTIDNSKMPENIYRALDKTVSLAEMYNLSDEHYVWRKIFHTLVRDGITFITHSAQINPSAYPDGGRYYKDVIWARVKSHYSPWVRKKIGIEFVCRYDAMDAGHDYDYEEDPIRYYALHRYGEAKANKLLYGMELKGTLLPAFLSREARIRLMGGQAESYSFCSSFNDDCKMINGKYFIGLKVTDEFIIVMNVHTESEIYTETATLTPDVWGEPYQESGTWSIKKEFKIDDINGITFHVMAGDVIIASGAVTKYNDEIGRPE